ncbi:MAG: AIPR family protein [Candidatus Omnitrophota bacterium]
MTILAHSLQVSPDKRYADIFLADGDGIVDGGHTYKLIRDSIEKQDCPENQYVKLEVITGVSRNMAVEISGGLNTAVQVHAESLANLGRKFKWIEDEILDMPYASQISYRENEDKPIDIREIIGYLTLFNVEHKELKKRSVEDSHPKEAYTSKSQCLKWYLEDGDSCEMLRPLLKDILYLSDYIHIKAREIYNEKTKGKYGAMTGVCYSKEVGRKNNKRKKKLPLIFSGETIEYKLFDATLYPILGSLRYLVEKKPGDNYYSWKLTSFEKVKKFVDRIIVNMILVTYELSKTYGRKPNPIGKDNNHWGNLYRMAKIEHLENLQ